MNTETELEKAAKLIQSSKISLLLNHQFWAILVMSIPIVPDETIDTACTDGKTIWYSPAFINSLTKHEVSFILAHEVSHIINFHFLRLNGRNANKFNRAGDYSINSILTKSGLTMPKDVLLDTQYEGMSAEQIYAILPDDPSDSSSDPGGCGSFKQPESGTDPSSVAQAEAAIKQLVQSAVMATAKAGNLPADLQQLASQITATQVNWREVLAAYMTEHTKDDYCWSRPNNRFLQSGFILPSLWSQSLGEIYLFVDTSGSIDTNQLNLFASEMMSIASQFNKSIEVIYVDTKVQGMETIEPDFEGNLSPKGGGGTSFVAPFVYLEEQEIQPAAVIYFTDLECYDYPKEPDYPVLWAVWGGTNGKAPWGNTIYIN